MAIAYDICWTFASMTMQNMGDHQLESKEKHDKECMEHNACEVARLKKGIEVSQVIESIQTARTEGSI